MVAVLAGERPPARLDLALAAGRPQQVRLQLFAAGAPMDLTGWVGTAAFAAPGPVGAVVTCGPAGMVTVAVPASTGWLAVGWQLVLLPPAGSAPVVVEGRAILDPGPTL